MTRITFTAEEQHEDIIEDVRHDSDAESTAAAVRECIDRASTLQQREAELQQREADLQQRIDELQQENERLQAEHEEEIADLKDQYEEKIGEMLAEYESEIERLEADRDRLRDEKRLLLERREEHTELVNAVKEEQSLAKRKAEAGLWTKTKWALFGMKDEESD